LMQHGCAAEHWLSGRGLPPGTSSQCQRQCNFNRLEPEALQQTRYQKRRATQCMPQGMVCQARRGWLLEPGLHQPLNQSTTIIKTSAADTSGHAWGASWAAQNFAYGRLPPRCEHMVLSALQRGCPNKSGYCSFEQSLLKVAGMGHHFGVRRKITRHRQASLPISLAPAAGLRHACCSALAQAAHNTGAASARGRCKAGSQPLLTGQAAAAAPGTMARLKTPEYSDLPLVTSSAQHFHSSPCMYLPAELENKPREDYPLQRGLHKSSPRLPLARRWERPRPGTASHSF
jgi:hypothetical protein